MGLSDKEKFLAGLSGEDKNVFTKIYDRALRAERSGAPCFGDFLSMAGLSLFAAREKYLPGCETLLFGGFDGAERKMAGFNAAREDFPIDAVKIEAKNSASLSHRDYLGSLMGLGLERERLGDIVVVPGGAIVFVHSEVADYVASSLLCVGRQTVSAGRINVEEVKLPEREYIEKSGTVASARLDSLCSLMLGRGRAAAGDFIRAGRVFVNGAAAEKADQRLENGDVLTVRGFGKAEVELGGKSKKDRIFVTLKIYK